MNRCAVATSLLTAVPSSYTAGQLALIDTKGGIVKTGAVGPYDKGVTIGVFVGTNGNPRQVGIIYPDAFEYEALAYTAAVGKTWRIGYNGSAGDILISDPTASANLYKTGTLTVRRQSLDMSTIPGWGDVFQKEVQIVPGDSEATVAGKLLDAADEIATAINAKYGASTITETDDDTDGSRYIQYAVAAGFQFTFEVDGIFEGTPIEITVGDDKKDFSGTTGAEVQALELESAVLDGYNPVQVPKYQLFDTSKYSIASTAKNYDAIIIRTVSPKQYQSPGHPKGWDVEFVLYTENSSADSIGTVGTAIKNLLAAVKQANQSVNSSEADALFLTKAEADALYAAKV